MTKINARKWIINRLKEHKWFAVVWSGHFGKYFVINKIPENNPLKLESEIYSAIYEEYDHKYSHEQVVRWSFKYDKLTWNNAVNLMKQLLKDPKWKLQ